MKHFLLNHLAHDLSTFCAKNFFLTSNNLDILLGTRFLLDNVAEKKVYGHISSILFPYFWEDKSGGRVPKTALFPHHLHTSLCPACSKWGGRQRKTFLQFFFFHGFCKSGLYSREGLQFLIFYFIQNMLNNRLDTK